MELFWSREATNPCSTREFNSGGCISLHASILVAASCFLNIFVFVSVYQILLFWRWLARCLLILLITLLSFFFKESIQQYFEVVSTRLVRVAGLAAGNFCTGSFLSQWSRGRAGLWFRPRVCLVDARSYFRTNFQRYVRRTTEAVEFYSTISWALRASCLDFGHAVWLLSSIDAQCLRSFAGVAVLGACAKSFWVFSGVAELVSLVDITYMPLVSPAPDVARQKIQINMHTPGGSTSDSRFHKTILNLD